MFRSPTPFPPGRGARIVASPARSYLWTAAVAAATFWLAYDGGTFTLTSRHTLGIVVWCAAVAAAALGLWPLRRPTRGTLLIGGLLALFSIHTLASTQWAASAERAFLEFDRVSLFLGIFVVAACASTRATLPRWSDGLGLAISCVGMLALASRFFPGVVSPGDALRFLPSAQTRLSYPLGYWNGLGIFLGLGVPLVLRAAVAARRPALRALALAPVPGLAAAIYLTSSRGGAATAAIGMLAFLALTARRTLALAAAAAAAAGSVAAVLVMSARSELVNAAEGVAVPGQARSAALLLLLVSALTVLAYGVAARRLEELPPVGRRWERTAVAAALVLLVAGIAAADPVQRFESFKQAPPTASGSSAEAFKDVESHLLSGSGSGRWQQWATAVDEFKSRPLAGRGAGSFEAWWAEHGRYPGFVKNAHSLYAETLGELGLIGLALLAAALLGGLALAGRRLVRCRGDERVTVAALTAAYLGFLVAAGIDWIWQLTVVSVVGVALLGLLAGGAAARSPTESPAARPRPRLALTGAAALAGLVLAGAQALPLLTQLQLDDSQAAADRRGGGADALSHARSARRLEPWASSPYLQLALVEEDAGRLGEARRRIRQAIERDRSDWRSWYVAARISAEAGAIPEARRNLAEARRLNPRSPLFATDGASSSASPSIG